MDNRPLKLAKLIHDTSSEQHETSDLNHAEHESVVEQACNELGIMLEHKMNVMASRMISIGIIDHDSKCFEAFTCRPSGYEVSLKTMQHVDETDVILDLI
jgi:hypothetical protein